MHSVLPESGRHTVKLFLLYRQLSLTHACSFLERLKAAKTELEKTQSALREKQLALAEVEAKVGAACLHGYTVSFRKETNEDRKTNLMK